MMDKCFKHQNFKIYEIIVFRMKFLGNYLQIIIKKLSLDGISKQMIKEKA